MANEATLVINAEIKQALNDLKKFQKTATTSMQASEKSVSALEKGFGGLKTTILAVGGAFAAFSGVKAAVGQLGDFSKGLSEIKSIADDSVKSNKNLGKELLKVANTFGTDATQQTSAFYSILSAGINDANKANKALVASNKLAVGGLASVEKSVDILTSSLNVYKKEGLSAEKASDILFATVKKGKTTVSELADSMGNVIPSAQAIGVSFDEVGGALATMTAGGISTAESVTGLRAVFNSVVLAQSKLKDETGEVAEAFDINSFRTKGLSVALKDMVNSVDGNVVELTRLLGSSKAVISVQSLMRNGFKDLNDSLDATKNSTGAADEAFKEMQASLGKQLSDAIQNVKNFALAVSLNFEGVIGKVLEKFNKAAKKSIDFMLRLSEALEANEKISFKKIAGGITSIGLAIAGVITILKGKQAIDAFGGLKKLGDIGNLKNLAKDLKVVGLAGLKFVAVGVAIVGAAFALDLLIRNGEKLANIFGGVVLKALLQVGRGISGANLVFNTFLDSIGLGSKKGTEEMLRLADQIDEANAQIKEIDRTIDKTVADGFDLGLAGQIIEFKDAITQAVEEPKEINIDTKKVTEDLTAAVQGVSASVGGGSSGGFVGPQIPDNVLSERNKKDVDAAAKAAKDEADRVSKIQADIASSWISGIIQGAEGARNALKTTAGGVVEIFAPGFGGAVGDIAGELTKGPKHVRSMITQFSDALPTLITSLADALPVVIEELAKKSDEIVGAIARGAPKIILELIKHAPKIIFHIIEHLPLIIRELIVGIIDGISESIFDLNFDTEAFNEKILEAFSFLGETFSNFDDKIRNAGIAFRDLVNSLSLNNIKDALGNFANGVTSNVSGFTSKIGGFVTGALEAPINNLKNFLGQLIDGFKSFFTSMLSLPATFLKTIGDGLKKILDKLNPVSGAKKAGGAIVSGVKKVGDFLGFAEGGIVPGGFPDDNFPANLTSGELVVPKDDVTKLRSFLNNQNSGSNSDGINTALLAQVIELLGQPMQVQTTAEVDGEALASVMLELSRQNARVA